MVGHRISTRRFAVWLGAAVLVLCTLTGASAQEQAKDDDDPRLAAALVRYRQGKFGEAARLLADAAAQRPNNADVLLLAGATEVHLEHVDMARAYFDRALMHATDSETADLARWYLDGLTKKPIAVAYRVGASLAAGYDTNVSQQSLADAELSGIGTTASAMTDIVVALQAARTLSKDWMLRVGYSLDQTLYANPAVDSYNLQVHTADAAVTRKLGERWNIRFRGRDTLIFDGTRTFGAFLQVATAGAMISFSPSDNTTTRVHADASWKHAFRTEDAYLGGRRFDGRLAQDLVFGPVDLTVLVRGRLEDIGTATADPGTLDAFCPTNPPDCTGTYLIPLAYSSWAGALETASRLLSWLYLEADVLVERRNYAHNSYIDVASASGPFRLDPRERQDMRLSAGAGLVAHISRDLRLAVRYATVVNRSNVDYTAGGSHNLDYANRNFEKHFGSIELAWGFL